MSAPVSMHLGLQVGEVGRLDRVRLVVREGAVELEVEVDHLGVDPAQDDRRGSPAIPLPASTTTFSRRPLTGASERRWSA